MKNIYKILLLMLACFILASCSKSSTQEEPEISVSPEISTDKYLEITNESYIHINSYEVLTQTLSQSEDNYEELSLLSSTAVEVYNEALSTSVISDTVAYAISGDYIYVSSVDAVDSAKITRVLVGHSDEADEDYIKKTPLGLEIYDNRLVVLSSLEVYTEENGYSIRSVVDIYDISDKTDPELLADFGQDGELVGTFIENGKLYMVSLYEVGDYDASDSSSFVPSIYYSSSSKLVSYDSISIAPSASYNTYAIICSYDLYNLSIENHINILGASSVFIKDSSFFILSETLDKEILLEQDNDNETIYDCFAEINTQIYVFSVADSTSISELKTNCEIEEMFVDAYSGNIVIEVNFDYKEYRVYESADNSDYVVNTSYNKGTKAYSFISKDDDTFEFIETDVFSSSDYTYIWLDDYILTFIADELIMSKFDNLGELEVLSTLSLASSNIDANSLIVDGGRNLIAFANGAYYDIYVYTNQNGFTHMSRIEIGEASEFTSSILLNNLALLFHDDGIKIVDTKNFILTARVDY